jgi:hypothetical protein
MSPGDLVVVNSQTDPRGAAWVWRVVGGDRVVAKGTVCVLLDTNMEHDDEASFSTLALVLLDGEVYEMYLCDLALAQGAE